MVFSRPLHNSETHPFLQSLLGIVCRRVKQPVEVANILTEGSVVTLKVHLFD